MFSVFIPTYNHEKTIYKSIMSIIEQIDENDEIIIIDDNSQDLTNSIIEKIITNNSKTNFQYVKKGNNYGINDSINRLKNIAKNRHILLLSGDDMFVAGKVSVVRRWIKKNQQYGILFCDSFVINEIDDIIGESVYPCDFNGDSIEKLLMQGRSNLYGHSQVCWNKEFLQSISDLPTHVNNEDDYLITISCASNKTHVIHDKLRYYRQSSTSSSYYKVNFALGIDEYLQRTRHGFVNKLNNYLELKKIFSSSIKNEKAVEILDGNIELLTDLIMALGQFNVFSRYSRIDRLLRNFRNWQNVYFRDYLVIFLSPTLYYYLKKFLYHWKYEK